MSGRSLMMAVGLCAAAAAIPVTPVAAQNPAPRACAVTATDACFAFHPPSEVSAARWAAGHAHRNPRFTQQEGAPVGRSCPKSWEGCGVTQAARRLPAASA